MADIDISMIEHKINTTAYTLFREWTGNVKKKFPQLDFTIKDESILGENVKKAVIAALKDIYKEENKEKSLLWKVGFFWGFVDSNLNCAWCHEYIHKQSNTYNMIVMLQSIEKFLISEEYTRNKIEEIYENALEKQINLRYYNSSLHSTKETIMSYLDLPLLRTLHNQINHPAITCCENILIKMINEFADQEDEDYLPEIENYFNEEEVVMLIKKNMDKKTDV